MGVGKGYGSGCVLGAEVDNGLSRRIVAGFG